MKKFAVLALMAVTLPTIAAEQKIVDIYNRSCMVCHAAGAAGAPKTHAPAEWQPRLEEKGMDTLVQSVVNGFKAMPPKGMCFDCSDADFKALIEFMAEPKG